MRALPCLVDPAAVPAESSDGVAPTDAARRGLLRVALGAAGLTAFGLSLPACSQGNPADVVSLETMRDDLAAGKAIVFDIREPNEHATGVAAGTRLLPMSQIGSRLAEIPKDPAQPVYLVCNTQNRSRKALAELRKMPGYEHLRYVEGGMSTWVQRGWPVQKPGG